LRARLAQILDLFADDSWRTFRATVLNAPGAFLRTGHTSAARYIGAEGDLGVAWRVDSHTTLQFLTACYKIGLYLRQTDPPGKNARYFSVAAVYKF
jgi:hypothetical protein